MRNRLVLGILGLFLILAAPLRAQKEGAIWYFGSHAGLDFNTLYPLPLTDGMIDTHEGVASISDKDGRLLFYTNGDTVYNHEHKIMDNGTGLFGNISSTQSSIIVPRPGNATQFYIFTVDKAAPSANQSHGINYSIVDMTLNGGLGKVITKNLPLNPTGQNTIYTEKIAVVKRDNDLDYWIITHEFGNWAFDVYLLDGSGVKFQRQVLAGFMYPIDLNDLRNFNATGYLKSSPKGDFLVSAIEGLHIFQLFKFDKKTGNIQYMVTLPAGDAGNLRGRINNAYGVEFSPTANYLYGSTRKGGYIYQWSLDDPTDTLAILNSTRIIRGPSSVLCGALQLAFNGKIYVSLGGQQFLGVIKSPIQENCNYDEHGATLLDNKTLKGGTAYFGLPTFLSDFFKAAEFYFENTCFGDTTNFYPSSTYTLEGVPTWEIYDSNNVLIAGLTSDPKTLNLQYRFPSPGTFLVKMRVTQFGSTVTYQREVTINPLPELNFADSTSQCKGSPAVLDAGDGAFYKWRDNLNLNVERFRNVYNPGWYVVTVTHYNGCSATDSTFVSQKPVPVIQDTVISPAACGASTGSISLTMEHPSDQYDFRWEYDTTNTTSRADGLPGGLYKVTITEKSTGCFITPQLTISEVGAPDVLIEPSIKGTLCAGTKVTLTATGATNYIWNDMPDTTATVEVVPWKDTTFYVEGYSYDSSTGKTCRGYGEISLKVYAYELPQLGADREACQGDTVFLHGGTQYRSWRWSTGDTTERVGITQSDPNLVLYVTDANKCVFTDTINVLVKPLPVAELGPDTTACDGTPVILSGGDADSWMWSTGDTIQTIRADQSGTYTLDVTRDGCTNSDSVKIYFKPLPAIDLGPDTTLCLSAPVRLYGGSGESYLWNGGDTTREIYTETSGQYWLKITLDGCSNTDTLNLTVKPLPEVDLGQDTTYCKSNPVTLSGGTGEAYLWSTEATTPTITIDETGSYWVAITKDGCTNRDTVNIRVNDPALLAIDSVSSTQVTCPGNRDGTLHIYAHGSGLTYEYSIDDGQTFYDSPIFRGLYGDNSFNILVREDKACTVSYPKTIEFREPDSIKLAFRMVSPSCETCPDGEINLRITGGTAPFSILWSTQDTVTFLSNMALGKYLVWVTDANKCRESGLADLTLDYPPFQIPNAFTPNGDGYNDRWEIASLKDFPGCTVRIFNRAGQLIWWSETGYPEPWDGKDKSGNVVPMGAYYYLIWLESDLKPVKGSVSVLR